MIRARDIMSRERGYRGLPPMRNVSAEMPAVDVLPRLLDSSGQRLGVKQGDEMIGVINRDSMFEGLGRMIAARDDCSLITLECAAGDYSASRIAHAVEDSDAHLVDLWSVPADGGKVQVTLRVRRDDPSPAVHSLERYGYDVVAAYGNENRDEELSAMRLLELRTLLNV